MKKLLILLAVILSVQAFGQVTPPSGYTPINARYNWLAGKFNDALGIPVHDTSANPLFIGDERLDTTGGANIVYVAVRLSGAKWLAVGRLYTAGNGLTLSGSTFKVDTFAITTRLRLLKAIDSIKNVIGIPTFQQVINSGNLLTSNSTVDGQDAHSFSFNGLTNFVVDAQSGSGRIILASNDTMRLQSANGIYRFVGVPNTSDTTKHPLLADANGNLYRSYSGSLGGTVFHFYGDNTYDTLNYFPTYDATLLGVKSLRITSPYGITDTKVITDSTISHSLLVDTTINGLLTKKEAYYIFRDSLPRGETNTASNVGTTTYGLYKTKSGVDLQFKSLTFGYGVTPTSNTNDVNIKADTTVNGVVSWPMFVKVRDSLAALGGGGGLSGGTNTRPLVFTGSTTYTTYANYTYDGTLLSAGKLYLNNAADNGSNDGAILIERSLTSTGNAHTIRVHDDFNRPGYSFGVFDDASTMSSENNGGAQHHASYQLRPIMQFTGTLNELIGLSSVATINSGATVSNFMAVDVNTLNGAGAATNVYGLRVRDQTLGTNIYPVYVETQTNSAAHSWFKNTTWVTNGYFRAGSTEPITIDGTDNGAVYPSIAYNWNPVSDTYISSDYIHRIQFNGASGIQLQTGGTNTAGATPSWITIFSAVNTSSTLGKTITNGYGDFKEIAAPSAPSSGFGRLYWNSSDSHLHAIDDGSTDHDLFAVSLTINGDVANRVLKSAGDGSLNGDANLTSNNGVVTIGRSAGSLARNLKLGDYASIGATAITGWGIFGSGIGTDVATTDGLLKTGTDAAAFIQVGYAGFKWYNNITGADGDPFTVAGLTPKMMLNNSGELIIGTTSDHGSEKLQLVGNGYVDGNLSVTGDFTATNTITTANILYSYETVSDADHPITKWYTKLPTATSTRTLTLPAGGGNAGRVFIVYNSASSGSTWQFNTSVKDKTGATFTTIAQQTVYTILFDGTDYQVISQY
jgi:hypothetical protein